MPTIFSHSAVPLAIGLGLGARVIPKPLLIAGMAASIIPDFDVLAFRLGVAYSHSAGHRGLTHSIVFALLLGFVALICARRFDASPKVCFAFVSIAALSHPLLDMLTNGGLGVALLWPFSDTRVFFPANPIEVSPLSLRRVLGETGVRVALSELIWIWVPALAVGAALRIWRRRHAL